MLALRVRATITTRNTTGNSAATMTGNGRITQVEIRGPLGLKKGDKVVVRVEEGGVRLLPAASALAAGYQSISSLRTPKTWKEIEEIVRDEQAQAIKDGGENHE